MIATPERPLIEWEIEPAAPLQPELPEIGRTPLSRLLIGAAMLLAKDGWTRGTSLDQQRRRCLIGALVGAWTCANPDNELGNLPPAGQWLPGLAQIRLAERGYHYVWNDHRAESGDEVIEVLLRFAAREDALA